MKVRLPRAANAEEIVKAFVKAANEYPPGAYILDAHREVRESCYEPGSVRKIDLAVKAEATLIPKRLIFRGYKGIPPVRFRLGTLETKTEYSEVDIAVIDGVHRHELEDGNNDLERFRPIFEKFIGGFYNELQPGTVQ